MKTANLIIIGFFCFSSAYGVEYKYEYEATLPSNTSTYYSSEGTSPFQTEPFPSNLAQTEQNMSSTGLDDDTELGGIERPANIGSGVLAMLLFSLSYCFKRYRSIVKK